jgi:ABC-type multidrug transport system fused ATPase/permease subunit
LSGTIKENIDPFHQYSDAELWSALDKVSLKETVSSMASQLDSQVGDNGNLFSVGQRQLLCLARAILKKTRIIVMDEATASLDLETDQRIQSALRNSFQDCTVLCVAHRIRTVMNCDKILVLERGKVVEFDRPETLSSNRSSRLSSLIEMDGGFSLPNGDSRDFGRVSYSLSDLEQAEARELVEEEDLIQEK